MVHDAGCLSHRRHALWRGRAGLSGWLTGKKLAFSVIRKRSGEKVVRENPRVRHREKSPDLGRGKKGKGYHEKQTEQNRPSVNGNVK